MKIPSGWTKGTAPGVVGVFSIAFNSPLENPSDSYIEHVSIGVFSFDTQSGASSFDTQFWAKYGALTDTASRNGYQLNIEQGSFTIDDRGAKWTRYNQILADGFKIQIYECYMVNGLKGYVLDFAAATDKFEQYKPIFDSIVSSWKFE